MGYIALVCPMILNRTVNIERLFHVVGYVVELDGWEVYVEIPPGFSPIIGHIYPAIIDVDQVIAILRIDPQAMMVSVQTRVRNCLKGFSPV